MKYPQPVSDLLVSAVSLAAEVGPDELVYRARHVEEMLEAMRLAYNAPSHPVLSDDPVTEFYHRVSVPVGFSVPNAEAVALAVEAARARGVRVEPLEGGRSGLAYRISHGGGVWHYSTDFISFYWKTVTFPDKTLTAFEKIANAKHFGPNSLAAHEDTGKLMLVVGVDTDRQSVHVKWLDGPDPSQWPDVHYNYAELEPLSGYPVNVWGWIILRVLHDKPRTVAALHKITAPWIGGGDQKGLEVWLRQAQGRGWVTEDGAMFTLTEAGREVCRL